MSRVARARVSSDRHLNTSAGFSMGAAQYIWFSEYTVSHMYCASSNQSHMTGSSLEKDRQVCHGRGNVEVIQHVGDVAPVISGVIDHMQQNVFAGHGASATADELKLDHLSQLILAQRIGVVDVPGVDFPLRGDQLLDRRMIGWIARGQAMRFAKQVALPHEVHGVGVILRADEATEKNRTGRNQLGFR